MLFILGVFVALGLWIYMLVRTAKSSMLLAILCFFFWPLLIVALIKNWSDEESNIKVPFFIYLVLIIFLGIFAAKAGRAMEQQESLLGVMRLLA